MLWGKDLPGAVNIPFEETVVRHANRDWAHNVTAEMMREWYRERDLLPGVEQEVIGQGSSLGETVERVLGDLGWKSSQV